MVSVILICFLNFHIHGEKKIKLVICMYIVYVLVLYFTTITIIIFIIAPRDKTRDLRLTSSPFATQIQSINQKLPLGAY